MKNIESWHEGVWHTLTSLRHSWPHAMLLYGRKGIGKLQFATHLAQGLLCQSPKADGHPCLVCQSCHWFSQGTHPDFRLVEPESEAGNQELEEATEQSSGKNSKKKRSRQISIAQIRLLSDFVALSSHQAKPTAMISENGYPTVRGHRIVILQPAEALNASASNALLKMLEEPPNGVVFILISHQRQLLLPTIRSRCQQFAMNCPSQLVALQWLHEQGVSQAETLLALAGGAPLLAQEMEHLAESHAQLVSQLTKGRRLAVAEAVTIGTGLGLEQVSLVLQKWLHDLMSCRLVGDTRYFQFANQTLQGLANTLDLSAMLRYQEQLLLASKSALHPLNAELQIEHLFMGYIQIFAVPSR